jgi:hypothetical protein
VHEAALTVVDLGKGGRVRVPSDGHQQSRRFAAIFTREQGVVSAVGVGDLQLCGSSGRGGGLLFVIGGDALPSGVIVSIIVRLQLEDELLVQVGCSVRGVKSLLGLSPLGLISRLLRGQVNLSI